MKTLNDMDVRNKRVLLRAGFDMPLDDNGEISDDSRIKETLPTIRLILDKGCSQLVIYSHMGRPKSKDDKKLRNDVVARKLSELLGMEVFKLDDCVGIPIRLDKKIVMMENLRFHKEEEANDEAFAKQLASQGDVFVNDAFSVLHRAHASIVGIPKYIPSCAGLLVEKEINALQLKNPERPLIGILGGSKISTKFSLIQELLKKVDKLLLGGAMIFTFYKAMGYEIGKSLYEESEIPKAKELLKEKKIILPVDIVVAQEIKDTPHHFAVPVNKIPTTWIGLDLGRETIELFEKEIDNAKTIVWNGPLGYFEAPAFAQATNVVAFYLAQSGKKVIVGGGDTVAALENLNIKDKFFHVSTGGGASMEVLAGNPMPGLIALEENEKKFFV
jgi:3-phosphoglycerate kinase